MTDTDNKRTEKDCLLKETALFISLIVDLAHLGPAHQLDLIHQRRLNFGFFYDKNSKNRPFLRNSFIAKTGFPGSAMKSGPKTADLFIAILLKWISLMMFWRERKVPDALRSGSTSGRVLIPGRPGRCGAGPPGRAAQCGQWAECPGVPGAPLRRPCPGRARRTGNSQWSSDAGRTPL